MIEGWWVNNEEDLADGGQRNRNCLFKYIVPTLRWNGFYR